MDKHMLGISIMQRIDSYVIKEAVCLKIKRTSRRGHTSQDVMDNNYGNFHQLGI